jgi:SRSO17 transposase
MTKRKLCPSVPGPIEEYAQQFDDLFETLAQRRGFRQYLQGLLLPRERNKTITGIVGSEPDIGAQDADVQQMQYFLTESGWDIAQINDRRLSMHHTSGAMLSHDGGALVIDDTGDRKSGRDTAHVARQYLGSIGKLDQGIVAVSSVWADEQIYYPLHLRAYTPAERLKLGK